MSRSKNNFSQRKNERTGRKTGIQVVPLKKTMLEKNAFGTNGKSSHKKTPLMKESMVRTFLDYAPRKKPQETTRLALGFVFAFVGIILMGVGFAKLKLNIDKNLVAGGMGSEKISKIR